jgi:hypothetical protein
MAQLTKATLPLTSRRSFIATYLLSLLGLVFGGIAMVASPLRIVFGVGSVIWNLAFLALGFVFIFVAAKTITLEIEIRTDGVKIRQLWKELWIPWKELKAISVAPTFANAEHLVIHYDTKRLSLATGFLKSPEALNKAFIEVAASANRDVEISPLTIRLYGPPPYGIFTDQPSERNP